MRKFVTAGIVSAIVFLPSAAVFAQNLPPLLRPSAVTVQVPTMRTIGNSNALPPLLRPGSRPRPSGLPTNVVATSQPGTICRDRSIQGQELRPVQGETGTCRMTQAVRVTSINGVVFEPAAVTTCTTAKATKNWLEKSAVPAWGRLGGGLSKVDVAASFACESPSERAAHETGSAIDISRFHLRNGLKISVESGWRDPVAGKVLREIHQGGCKAFKTALGPDAGNRTRDHLHFDTANGRGKCQ